MWLAVVKVEPDCALKTTENVDPVGTLTQKSLENKEPRNVLWLTWLGQMLFGGPFQATCLWKTTVGALFGHAGEVTCETVSPTVGLSPPRSLICIFLWWQCGAEKRALRVATVCMVMRDQFNIIEPCVAGWFFFLRQAGDRRVSSKYPFKFPRSGLGPQVDP